MPEPQTTGRLWALGVSREKERETGARTVLRVRAASLSSDRRSIKKQRGRGKGRRSHRTRGLVTTERAPWRGEAVEGPSVGEGPMDRRHRRVGIVRHIKRKALIYRVNVQPTYIRLRMASSRGTSRRKGSAAPREREAARPSTLHRKKKRQRAHDDSESDAR